MVVLYLLNFTAIKAENRRTWISQDNWRVCSNDKLCIFTNHHLEHGQEDHLSHRRECWFGFVQQIQTIGYKARFKQSEVTFAMRIAVQILSVRLPEGSQFTQVRHLGQSSRSGGTVFIFNLRFRKVFL